MNNDWRNELGKINEGAYTRLCECRSTKMDFIAMCNLVMKYNPTITSQEAYEYMFEWVCEWNSQGSLGGDINASYKWVMARIHR